MHGVESVTVQCPSCGESIELLVDCSVEEQEYIEDCEVCCRPMTVTATIVEGEPRVRTSR
jgi:hypothetical protein